MSKILLLFLLLTLATWRPITVSSAKLPPGIVIPALFALGDSTIDTGNNNYRLSILKANHLPYGKDFMGGNMPTGRFGNAKILTDLFAEAFGIKEYVPPYLDPNLKPEELLTGVSFASAGSGYDPLTSNLTTAMPVTKQLDLFEEYVERLKSMVGENQTSFILSNAVFLLSASSNDIAITYFDTSIRRIQYDYNSYADLLVNAASSLIQELYGLGARRFAVLGAPPVGCLPAQRTVAGGLERQCAANNNELAQLYNPKLVKEIRVLNSKLVGSSVVYMDFYNNVVDIIDNPMKYGFEVVDKGCCGSGLIELAELCNKLVPVCSDDSKYYFWDSFHPTEKGYHIIVNSLVGNLLGELSGGNPQVMLQQ